MGGVGALDGSDEPARGMEGMDLDPKICLDDTIDSMGKTDKLRV